MGQEAWARGAALVGEEIGSELCGVLTNTPGILSTIDRSYEAN